MQPLFQQASLYPPKSRCGVQLLLGARAPATCRTNPPHHRAAVQSVVRARSAWKSLTGPTWQCNGRGSAAAPSQAGDETPMSLLDDSEQQMYEAASVSCSRRLLGGWGVLMASATISSRWLAPPAAEASLQQLPASRLQNSYFLVRAGESEAESAGVILTNPVAKTSMTSGLSSTGKRQVVVETYPALQQLPGFEPDAVWLWPSITQRSYQSAEVLGALLGLGRSRIVPEYSFLDARGLGVLEGQRIDVALPGVYEGDRETPAWRPPSGVDGTPAESVEDVLVRLRQLLSVMETQWVGQSIVIISPDSDNLSVIQAAVLGVDLRRHTDFAFLAGEARALQLSPDEQVFAQSSSFQCLNPPACK